MVNPAIRSAIQDYVDSDRVDVLPAFLEAPIEESPYDAPAADPG